MVGSRHVPSCACSHCCPRLHCRCRGCCHCFQGRRGRHHCRRRRRRRRHPASAVWRQRPAAAVATKSLQSPRLGWIATGETLQTSSAGSLADEAVAQLRAFFSDLTFVAAVADDVATRLPRLLDAPLARTATTSSSRDHATAARRLQILRCAARRSPLAACRSQPLIPTSKRELRGGDLKAQQMAGAREPFPRATLRGHADAVTHAAAVAARHDAIVAGCDSPSLSLSLCLSQILEADSTAQRSCRRSALVAPVHAAALLCAPTLRARHHRHSRCCGRPGRRVSRVDAGREKRGSRHSLFCAQAHARRIPAHRGRGAR